MLFELDDIIQVQRLATARREVDGPAADPPQPRIGDDGIVVAILGENLYLVEHSTADGQPVWMAEFRADELMLLMRGDAS